MCVCTKHFPARRPLLLQEYEEEGRLETKRSIKKLRHDCREGRTDMRRVKHPKR